MTGNSNLDGDAASCIADAAYGMSALDMDGLRDKTGDLVDSAAENACIYTGDALDIISRYESDPAAMDADDCLSGATYTANQWTLAMTAYAHAIARCVIEADAHKLLDEIEEAANALYEARIDHGGEHDGDEPRVSRDCIHGWAVHDREDKGGVHYWSEPELEGCRAVAVRAGGLWLSYTWTPAAPEAASAGEA